MLRLGSTPLERKWIYMNMSKFVHFRAQRDLNGAEITVRMTTESHKYTWPSTIWLKMEPGRKGRPGEQKWNPKTAKGCQNDHLATKQWNLNDFRKRFGLFLEPFWGQNQGKNQWILVAKIDAQKVNRLYAKHSIKRCIKTRFLGWWIQRFKPKYIMWKPLNSCRKTVFFEDQHTVEIKKIHGKYNSKTIFKKVLEEMQKLS